jgi:hypothetical protein
LSGTMVAERSPTAAHTATGKATPKRGRP